MNAALKEEILRLYVMGQLIGLGYWTSSSIKTNTYYKATSTDVVEYKDVPFRITRVLETNEDGEENTYTVEQVVLKQTETWEAV